MHLLARTRIVLAYSPAHPHRRTGRGWPLEKTGVLALVGSVPRVGSETAPAFRLLFCAWRWVKVRGEGERERKHGSS